MSERPAASCAALPVSQLEPRLLQVPGHLRGGDSPARRGFRGSQPAGVFAPSLPKAQGGWTLAAVLAPLPIQTQAGLPAEPVNATIAPAPRTPCRQPAAQRPHGGPGAEPPLRKLEGPTVANPPSRRCLLHA